MIPNPVFEIPRDRLGNRAVPAAAGMFLPGTPRRFVAAWVDFAAANAFRGAEFILYTSAYDLPN